MQRWGVEREQPNTAIQRRQGAGTGAEVKRPMQNQNPTKPLRYIKILSLLFITASSLTLVSVFPLSADAGQVAPESSLHSCADTAVLPLAGRHPRLQQNLEKGLLAAGFGEALQRGKLGMSVVDMSGDQGRLYAGVNDDVMMYAASLPKIAILLAVMREVEKGRLRWSESLKSRLSAMITQSSNGAASWATNLVGLHRIARTVQHPALCFYDPPHGGLWMGRAYSRGARANRDPLGNLSHAATARQAARFYAMLDARIILSRRGSRRMLEMMSPPRINHKLVKGLGDRPEVEFLARKSGSWRTFHADSALIQHQDSRYVVVVLSDLADGDQVVQQLARLVDDLIMAGEHRVPLRASIAAVRVPQG